MSPKKTYTVDGKTYAYKTFADFHIELAANSLVESFVLPTVQLQNSMKQKKFHAYKVVINGITFDSMMESKYYLELLSQYCHGEIKNFANQVTFELQEKFKINNKWIRPITYIADFVVWYNNGTTVVVDVKGKETAEFKLKKKMFLYKYGQQYQFVCLQYNQGQWMPLEEIRSKKRNAAKKKVR